MVRIGITGCICAGKSSLCKLLESSYNCLLINADNVGHECYIKDTQCYYKLIENFTNDIIDKESHEIDRRKLGSIVFSSKEKMEALQAIVWPEIRQKLIDQMNIYEANNPNNNVIIVEAAVLLEANWQDLFDIVVLINADDDIVIKRLTNRNNFTIEDANKRLAAQLTLEQRKEKLSNINHIIIDNNEDMDSLISNSEYIKFIEKYFKMNEKC